MSGKRSIDSSGSSHESKAVLHGYESSHPVNNASNKKQRQRVVSIHEKTTLAPLHTVSDHQFCLHTTSTNDPVLETSQACRDSNYVRDNCSMMRMTGFTSMQNSLHLIVDDQNSDSSFNREKFHESILLEDGEEEREDYGFFTDLEPSLDGDDIPGSMDPMSNNRRSVFRAEEEWAQAADTVDEVLSDFF